jgi:hypothetical protein
MAAMMGITPLTATEILDGDNGANLTGLTQAQKEALTTDTPLWFYIRLYQDLECILPHDQSSSVGGVCAKL